MCRKITINGVLLAGFLSGVILFLTMQEAYAAPSASAVSGRLGATYDSRTGAVTAMVSGYCEGKPVTVGPKTWAMAGSEFSRLKAEDIAMRLCAGEYSLKRITKSTNNGKEIVADIVIVRSKQ